MNALLGDDAYALDEEAPIELRILHGAQAGSRLCLAVGEYMLGSDDSCTLILEGSGIEDRHAILRFDGDDVWIEPVDGVVRNAHGDDIDDEQQLIFGLPVELGNVWISVDREDVPWPDPKSVVPLVARQAGEAPASAASDSESETDGVVKEEISFGDQATFGTPSKHKSKLALVLLFVLVLLAGGFGVFSLLQANHAKPVIDVAAPMPEVVELPLPQAALDVIKVYPISIAPTPTGLASPR